MHLAGDAFALRLLRVDDRLQQLAFVDHRRRVRGQWRVHVLLDVCLRLRDDRTDALEQLPLALQRGQLRLHRHTPADGGGVVVGRPEDLVTLEVRRVRAGLLDPRLGLVLARFESRDLGLRRFEEKVELTYLRGDPGLLGDEVRADVGGRRQFPISGPLIHPCRIAYTTACVRSFTESLRRMLDMWFFTVCSEIARV